MKSIFFLFFTTAAFGGVQYYQEQEVFEALTDYLSMKSEREIFVGKTSIGLPCKVEIVKTEGAISFILSSRRTFVLRAFSAPRARTSGSSEQGRFDVNVFTDAPHSLIHGQFGVSDALKLERDQNELRSLSYRQVKQQDLDFKILEKVNCRQLRLLP